MKLFGVSAAHAGDGSRPVAMLQSIELGSSGKRGGCPNGHTAGLALDCSPRARREGTGRHSPVVCLRWAPPARGEGTARIVVNRSAARAHPRTQQGASSFANLPVPAGAHPRTRGTDNVMHPGLQGPWGSPPHAGKGPPATARQSPKRGLTPARREGTSRANPRQIVTRAHPRTRGRDRKVVHKQGTFVGSPPHAGKGRTLQSDRATGPGLTPARGEGTCSRSGRVRRPGAHPPYAGKGPFLGGFAVGPVASPPHAGKGPWKRGCPHPGAGLTPARGEGTLPPKAIK